MFQSDPPEPDVDLDVDPDRALLGARRAAQGFGTLLAVGDEAQVAHRGPGGLDESVGLGRVYDRIGDGDRGKIGLDEDQRLAGLRGGDAAGAMAQLEPRQFYAFMGLDMWA